MSIIIISCNNNEKQQSGNIEDFPVYSGIDLGFNYTLEKTTIKVWAPSAEEIILRLYKDGDNGAAFDSLNFEKKDDGLWQAVLKGDWKNTFYTVQAKINGKLMNEVADIYAKAVGVNGKRAAIVDLESTNPENWNEDKSPRLNNFSDIILYELHIRDISTHTNSGISYRGKFLGLAEENTQNPAGLKTGIAHIKELGVTHVHILPAFDFRSIDESALEKNIFNWGYDPQNYNVPEGSYSTNPYSPTARIIEFKKMVQAFHRNGIRVILDVVYNHTGETETSNFNQIVPDYYYRKNTDSSFSNASACGNETASERPMMRKFIIESLKYWVEEYHIDGFRFDLMGIHDIETMNYISQEMNALDKEIFLYGEGWAAGNSPLDENLRAVKKNAIKLQNIAVFSDDMRDGIKGHWAEKTVKGFVNGDFSQRESVKFGIVGATQHPQINYASVNYSDSPYVNSPLQCINYVSCHDDLTLWDKLKISRPDLSENELEKMHKLCNAIVLTSQGIPFLHAGVEIRRHKQGVHNSFESPDAINQIDWQWKTDNIELFNFYKSYIELRKAHPAFRMKTQEQIQQHLEFIEPSSENIIAYCLKNNANGDSWKDIVVIINAGMETEKVKIPDGTWTIIAQENEINMAGIKILKRSKIKVPELSMLILAGSFD